MSDRARSIIIALAAAAMGVVIGAIFGVIGAAITGNAAIRSFGPFAGLISAIIAWRATAKDRKPKSRK